MKQALIQFVLSILFFPGFVFFISAITDLCEGKRTVVKCEDGKWIFDREECE